MSIYIEDKNGKRRKFAGVGSEKDYIDDKIASEKMTWSSEKILDTLCPPFTETGNPITCNPVEDYPLDVTVTMEPIQEGTGDPSPDNVRPITGRDSVQVTRCGKNLLDISLPRSFSPDISTRFSLDLDLTGTFAFSAQIDFTEPGTTTSAFFSFVVDEAEQYISSGSIKEGKIISGHLSKLSLINWSNSTGTINEIQLELGSTPTAYEPYQGSTTTLTLPETIYGGTVDAVTGVGSDETLFLELAVADMDNHEDYPGWRNIIDLVKCVGNNWNKPLDNEHFVSCNICSNGSEIGVNTTNPSNPLIYLNKDSFGLTQTQWKEQYPDLVLQLCLKRITPEPFQATGNRPLSALPGTNTLYTDGNSLTVSGSTSPVSAIESFKANVQASANQAEAVANILLGGA